MLKKTGISLLTCIAIIISGILSLSEAEEVLTLEKALSVARNSNPRVIEAAGRLYEDLQKAGVEVLFDDRLESPGVKFNDADLIGIPFRVTISPRTLEGNNVEFKLRIDKKAQVLPLAGLVEFLKDKIAAELK